MLKMSSVLRFRILQLANALDRKERRVARRRHRMLAEDPFLMSETDFIQTYRLTKDSVRQLIQCLTPKIKQEQRNDALSVESKVLITLAFFGTGSYQTLVGQNNVHRVSQPTTSRAIRQITMALNNLEVLKQFVQFPMTIQDRDRIKQTFLKKFKIPGVVGCIDSTQVCIVKPKDNEERFLNNNGYHSLNVMIICDADLKILSIDPNKPGSTHDSEVWRGNPLHSFLNQRFDEGEQIYLLGDSSYTLEKNMMTPCLNTAADTSEAYFNELQVSAHNTAKRCISVLKARFRCLQGARALHYDPVFAGQIVNACAVLHNIACDARVPVPEHSEQDMVQAERQELLTQTEEMGTVDQSCHNQGTESNEARAFRQSLIRSLWNDRNK